MKKFQFHIKQFEDTWVIHAINEVIAKMKWKSKCCYSCGESVSGNPDKIIKI